MAWKPEITDWRFHECSPKSLQYTSRPLVLDSWERGQAKCGIKLSPESLAPQQDAALLLLARLYVNGGSRSLTGFLWIFNMQFLAVLRRKPKTLLQHRTVHVAPNVPSATKESECRCDSD